MKMLRKYLALVLLIIVEIAAGVLLLVEPGGVAKTVLFLSGIVMVIIGGMNLVRFVKEKPEGFGGFIMCMAGVLALGVGIVCLIPVTQDHLAEQYRGLFYGMILIAFGVYEAQMFFTARRGNQPVSVVLLISAILAFIYGVLVALNQSGKLIEALSVDQLAAVCMLLQAATDLAALILAVRKDKPSKLPVVKGGDHESTDIEPAK